MRMLRRIGDFIGGLWAFSRRFAVSMVEGLRWGSPAAALTMFLFLVFAIVGLVLVLLGFDLGDVDAWIERQGGWLSFLGDWAFSIVCGIVLFFCVAVAGALLFGRKKGEKRSYGGIIAALVIGYFAWIGMTMPA